MKAKLKAQKKNLSPTFEARPSSGRHAAPGFLLVNLWSCLIALCFVLLSGMGRIFPRLQALVKGRKLSSVEWRDLFSQCKSVSRRYLFFCSSAGEYEQALPLISRLQREGNAFVLIVFFSPSGLKYAKARGESLPFMLAPPDTLWDWQKIFAALKPQAVFVVRHELWPAFLYTAEQWAGQVFLINASQSLANAKAFWSRLSKGWLLPFFAKVFVVDEADRQFFQRVLGVPGHALRLAGDSKYDRVLERAELKKTTVAEFKGFFDSLLPCASRLVIGSAWSKDVLLCFDALGALKGKVPGGGLQLVVALHEPSAEALRWVQMECEKRNFSYRYFAELYKQATKGELQRVSLDVILIDKMGILAELYGVAQLAFVGGALHYQVHNVLEPASYGLALAYGPLYKNSGEAVKLVEAGLASVIGEVRELVDWWQRMMASDYEKGKETLAYIRQYCGAADCILKEID